MRRKNVYSSGVLIFLAFASVLLFSGQDLMARIRVFDHQYRVVRLVKDTPLPGCNGARIGSDGALYVVHSGAGTVTRIDLKTMKAKTFVPAYEGVFIPDDVTADKRGNLFVTGTTPLVGEVYRIDKKGVKSVIASGFIAPNGIQYNPRTGRLFMSECFQANRVFELDPEGVREPRLILQENQIAVPEGFDFDPGTNDLIIPDMATGKILRVHPDTGEIATIAEKFITPIALKVGPDRMAYVPELATGAVYRISLDGKKREKIAQLTPGLDNLAITRDGRLFVTSYWDSTVYQVETNGSGKFKTLFPTGANTISGILVKNGALLVSDAIMVRRVERGKYVKTKLNAWARSHMPLPIGLADGPGGQIFWPDPINNAVAIGNPVSGEFKAIAGGLNRPMSVLMSRSGADLYAAEYAAGQITAISLKDGSKKVLGEGLEGPLAMALLGNTMYVAEAKASRISRIDCATGKKEVFLWGVAAKPVAVANDGSGNLLILDGATKRLLRVRIRDLKVSVVAKGLPVGITLIGNYPPVEWPYPMFVDKDGSIYLSTVGRGVVMLQKGEKYHRARKRK
jgi:sugar lactone lactonase YvrE